MHKALVIKSFDFRQLLLFVEDKLVTEAKVIPACIGLKSMRLAFFNPRTKFSVFLMLPPQVLFTYTPSRISIVICNFKWFSGYRALALRIIKSVSKALIAVTYGHYRTLQFIGFRFRQRWFRAAQILRYKAGYNKRIWLKAPYEFVSIIRKISPKKRTHIYFSFYQSQLNALVEALYKARPRTLYKGRGVSVKEQPMVLKEGKKAMW